MNRLLCTAFFALVSASTLAAELTLEARAVPDICEFVYRVETDLRFDLIDAPEGLTSLEIDYEFVPAYADDMPADAIGKRIGAAPIEATFVTMSTNPRYLYSDLWLRARLNLANGDVVTLPASSAEGYWLDTTTIRDRCYPGGRAATPYRAMTLEVRRR